MTKPLTPASRTSTSSGGWFPNPATLGWILEVIKNATVPTFINTVPHNFGYSSAGSMKADEWRVLSMIYLPLALCILWNDQDGQAPSSDHAPLHWLDTSMALFQAITLMCRYTTSKAIADRMRNHIIFWSNTLHTVFPHTREHPFRPNRHVILHIPDFLILFGPVMFWWAFPFERLIGHLQTVNTNNIIGGMYYRASVTSASSHPFLSGALEMTLLTSYLRSANFRRWLAMPGCPPIILSIRDILQQAFWRTKYQARDDDTFHHVPKELAHYPVNGMSFSRAKHHLGNSIILYPKPNSTGTITAGSIHKIVLEGDKRFCYVAEQQPLPSHLHDPFARYPDFPAVTYSSHVYPGLDKIEVETIITHATLFKFSKDRAAILSLSRVRSCTFSRNHSQCLQLGRGSKLEERFSMSGEFFSLLSALVQSPCMDLCCYLNRPTLSNLFSFLSRI